MTTPLEHGYIGLSESVSSMTSSEKSSERCNNGGLNLKATELRLGLPGSESPERGGGLEEKGGYPLPLQKNFVSGAKRGFSDAIDGASAKWVFSGNGGSDNDSAKCGNLFAARVVNEGKTQQGGANNSAGKNGVSQSPQEKNTQLSPPAAKEQVVGWPPIRSFRKNSMISSVKNDDDAEGKSGSGSLYVKVSLDGAPYLRKIDLKTFACYMELSSALGKMFSCFTIGHCGSHGISSRDGLNESRLMDLLHGSEYVLTYEDKDGDWMLVGDVPWEKKLKKNASGCLFDETILNFIVPVFRLYVYRHMQEDEDHEEFRGDWARPKKDGEGVKPMKKVENFECEWVVEALKG